MLHCRLVYEVFRKWKNAYLQWQTLRNLLQSPVLFSSVSQPYRDMDHTILNTHLSLEYELNCPLNAGTITFRAMLMQLIH